jgi:regulator of RNase E activity RraA
MMLINPNADPIERSLMKGLGEIEPATVGHFLPSGCMKTEFRASLDEARIIGQAVTVRIPSIDSTLCHKVVEIARPGDVIVVDRCGDMTHACWGAAMTLAASLRGIAGAVVDGSVTDILDIRRIGFPVFFRRLSPLTTRILGLEGEINVPVQCGGIIVNPGDLVIADINGVCVLPPGSAQAVIEHALHEQEKEKTQFSRMKEGVSLASLSGADGKIPPEAFREHV